MLNVSVVNNIDVDKIVSVTDNDFFWYHMAREWYRLLQKYTPRDTGNLMENVSIVPKEITYNAPYAAVVYNHEGANFRKDKNPYATAQWDVAARATELPKLIEFGNEYLKREI